MDLALIRNVDGYRSDGIFSTLFVEATGHKMAVTVEHAYPVKPGGPYLPIIPPGTFDAVRGKHRLDGMTEDFETFEVVGVPGHSGLLFHWGNYNRSSKGCICTGDKRVATTEDFDKIDGPDDMVTNSRQAFVNFMTLQEGIDKFKLRVEA